MKVWRVLVQQLPSGVLGLFDQTGLPRERSSIPKVVELLAASEVEFGKHLWKAAPLEVRRTGWVAGAIGRLPQSPDADSWDVEAQTWRLGEGTIEHATEFLIELRSKTMYIRHNRKLGSDPGAMVGRLEKLLNQTLKSRFPNSAWVFNLEIERNTEDFEKKFAKIETLQVMRVLSHVPNGDGAELLDKLHGISGETGAESIETKLVSTNGIDKASSFVRGALSLMRDNLAVVAVKGITVYMDQSGGAAITRVYSARSDEKGSAAKHELLLPKGVPVENLSEASIPTIERQVGPLPNEIEVTDPLVRLDRGLEE